MANLIQELTKERRSYGVLLGGEWSVILYEQIYLCLHTYVHELTLRGDSEIIPLSK